LKDSLNILSSNKKQSEFQLCEKLGVEPLTVEMSASDARMPQSHKQIATILQEMTSKNDSIHISHYFRAGRAYFTINHKMGLAGNLFFKSFFTNVLGGARFFPVEHENNLCVIFRI
jgi:hypothetical protein